MLSLGTTLTFQLQVRQHKLFLESGSEICAKLMDELRNRLPDFARGVAAKRASQYQTWLQQLRQRHILIQVHSHGTGRYFRKDFYYVKSETMKVIPSTAFPRALLPPLFLTDRIPPSSLLADPRVSYSGYVPDAHYPNTTNKSEKLPLLVAIHGTGRDTSRYINVWQDWADKNKCAVFTPLFPGLLQGPLDLDGYHFLGRAPAWNGQPAESWLNESVNIESQTDYPIQTTCSTLRYDLLLLAMLDEIGTRWPGISTSKIFLTGFSGGGQFVHRFLYLHPERLASVCVGAPGSTTLLDYTQNWPTGLRNIREVFGKDVHVDRMRGIPILGVVGSNDTRSETPRIRLNVPGSYFGTEEEINQTRVQRATRLIDNWKEAGLNASQVIVQGPGHDMEKVNAPVEKFFAAQIKAWWEAGDE